MGTAVFILLLILIIAPIVFFCRSEEKENAEKEARIKAEEEARKALEASRKAEAMRVAEEKRKKEAELARLRREEEKRQRIALQEKKRLITSPSFDEYVRVEEFVLDAVLPIPKVEENVYFIGIEAGIHDDTREILFDRFKEIGRTFIDMNIFRTMSSDVLRYNIPAAALFDGEPSKFYSGLVSMLPSEEKHMFLVRYDSGRGFLAFDAFVDGLSMVGRRLASYAIYLDNNCCEPGEEYFRKRGQIRLDEETRFQVTEDCRYSYGDRDEYIHSGVSFRIGSPDESFRKPSFPAIPRRKTTDEQFTEDVRNMMDELLDKVKELQLNGVSLDMIHALIGQNVKLSRIRITSTYRIFLPDYNNLEIRLNPLQTAVYIFFLNHPKGVLFYDLPDYKEELLSIYEKVSGREDKGAIVKSINAVIDRFDGSISTQCSRIKRAFVSVLSDDIAKNYYISGGQASPKSIPLDRSLVIREDR